MPSTDDPARHHPGSEVTADQLDNLPDFDLALHVNHQHIMADPIKEFLKIKFHAPAVTRRHMGTGDFDGLASGSARTKTVAIVAAVPVGSNGPRRREYPTVLFRLGVLEFRRRVHLEGVKGWLSCDERRRAETYAASYATLQFLAPTLLAPASRKPPTPFVASANVTRNTRPCMA